ncbi:MAG TPA: hypothetical protein VFM70_02190 [Salinimicrobium sp.]|nr:hypothetical protein [Salinimicrobium sp.]
MENSDTPEKSGNFGKAILGLIISILFVVLGFFLLSDQMAIQSDLPVIVIKGIGVFNILVFGLMGLLHLKRLLKRR